jgi:hypothetical protein
MLKPWKRRRWPLTSVSKIEARTEFGEGGAPSRCGCPTDGPGVEAARPFERRPGAHCPALYAAHMVLSQVDWSLRNDGDEIAQRFVAMGTALLDAADAG